MANSCNQVYEWIKNKHFLGAYWVLSFFRNLKMLLIEFLGFICGLNEIIKSKWDNLGQNHSGPSIFDGNYQYIIFKED